MIIKEKLYKQVVLKWALKEMSIIYFGALNMNIVCIFEMGEVGMTLFLLITTPFYFSSTYITPCPL